MNRRTGAKGGTKRLWYYISNYRFHSLFVRSFLVSVALLIVLLMVVSNLVTSRSSAIIREEIRLLSLQSLYKVRDVADALVQQTGTLLESLARLPEVEIAMRSDIADVILGKEYIVQITGLLKNLLSANKYLSSIFIYSERYRSVIDNFGRYDFDRYEDVDWHGAYAGLRGPALLQRLRTVREPGPVASYQDVVSLVRSVSGVGTERTLGAVVVNLRLDDIGREIGGAPGARTMFFLVDEERTFYFLRGDPLLTAEDLRGRVEAILDEGGRADPLFREIPGTGYTLAVLDSAFYPWRYAMYIPSDLYIAKIDGFRAFMAVVVSVIVIIALAASFLISMKTFRPIANIVNLVENPLSKLRAGVSPSRSADEVRYIAKRIAQFAYVNKQLRTEVRKQIENADRIQRVALDAQIHPHFLYNTLESIRWAAVGLTGGENRVSEMVQDLSTLLRISLDGDNNLLPLSTEVDHAKRYVRLLMHRHEKRFEVRWNVHDEVLDCKVTKLMLQPLIENAIYHGLKPKRYVGLVEVDARPSDGGIALSVTDDGVGIPAALCRELNESFARSFDIDHEHIGLRNVNQRVRLVFGSRYGLTVRSEPGAGTCARLRLPAIR